MSQRCAKRDVLCAFKWRYLKERDVPEFCAKLMGILILRNSGGPRKNGTSGIRTAKKEELRGPCYRGCHALRALWRDADACFFDIRVA